MTSTTLSTTSASVSGEQRREAGRVHFTAVLTRMLQDVSHPEMALLADWALNEPGCLHTSQLSHLRNAKMRMLGVKSIDALGRINTAAHAFKQSRSGGKTRKAFKNMETAQTTARIESILENYEPILYPETDEPLNAGDLMMVYLGYIEIPGVGPTIDESKDYSAAASKLGAWIEELLDERGLRFREAVAVIKDKWQGSDEGLTRFTGCASGVSEYSDKDLATDWEAITKVVSVLMDDTITPEELLEMVIA